MHLDPLLLSRLQFVWVIALHILLPAFTVGLASFIAVMEGLHVFAGKAIYYRISIFWVRIFSVAFGMGVVSGIVMPFQFGTNWSRFSLATANVLSPLLAYEGLTAFFLEATFLGVLLFGRKLVPRWVHFFAALMVAAGTLFSTFWILSVNSWMQTPAGFTLTNGRFSPANWGKIIFNPSFPYRYMHTVCGFYVTTGFVVLGVAAYLVRHKTFAAEGKVIMSITLWLLLALVPAQIAFGDMQGENTLKYQPAKVAAMEARWTTQDSFPLILFAVPDAATQTNHDVIEIPYLGSLILTHSLHGSIKGLNDFPADQRPPIDLPFYAFRIMVGIGLAMLVLILTGNLLRRGGRLFVNEYYLRACEIAGPFGFIAVLAGWTTTEVGRQPWTVYGLLRTADSVTPSLTGFDVLLSLLGYMLVYSIIFPSGLFLMARIVRRGPVDDAANPPVLSGRGDAIARGLPERGIGEPAE
jgi:cytochrome d ubiquinol oxidase subunit I